MPASFETFSMATLEAMAAGLPVVISDRMGVRDIVSDGVNGFVVPADDAVESCVDRLEQLLQLRTRASMAEAARVEARRHAWDHVADAVASVFTQRLSVS
jgi:glycosyltransferase involved in cell wall biosynthesis